MRKKLLTILVSVFMIMATFAVNVFADEPANIEQLFNTYAPNFPKEIDSTVPDKAWISSNNICYISQDYSLCFDSGSGYSSLPVTEEISRIVDTNNFKCNYFNIIFNIENDKLISIERNYTEESSSLNGIYTAKVTIADILPSNFPASTEDESWCNSKENNDVYIYNDGTYLVFADTPVTNVVLVSSVLTKAEKDPTWSDTTTCRLVYSKDNVIIQFNMTGDYGNELENIVVARCWFEDCEGTYGTYSVTYNANGATSGSAPANQTKTAGVDLTLATNTGNLAKTDYTFAGWNTQADGKGTHYDAGETYETNEALFLYAEWTGASATKTITDILDKAVGGFPTSVDNAWVDPSYDYIAYKSNNLLYIQEKSSISILTFIDVNKNVSKVSDSQYKYHDFTGNYDVLFNLNSNNKLVSIELTGISDYRSVLNGTYEAPKTIANILPEDFPTKKAAGWIKEDGSSDNRIYVDGENLMIGTSSFALNSVVEKDDDNYKYTKSILPITFIMDSNGLEKINFLTMSAPASGDYVPYKYEKEQTESKPQGYTGDLVFKTNGKYTDPSQVVVKVDGTKLNQNTDYTVDQGSIIVTLLGNYIKNLAPKTYTISIGVKDGETELYSEITSEFTITAAPTPTPTPNPDTKPRYKIPNTGVEGMPTNNHSLLKLSSLSLLAIGTYLVIKKKKDND